MRKSFSFLVALLLACTASAQQNVYIDETVGGCNRVRIVSGVDRIDFTPDSLTAWSGMSPYGFNVHSVDVMSLREMDPWRTKVMPDTLQADFDFDIAFLESDKDSLTAEPEVTDQNDPLYADFVAHSAWTKTVYVAYNDTSVSVTGDTDSLTVSVAGAHLTVTTSAIGVKYILSGTSSDACFKLYSAKKASLVLNGLNLTNPHGPVINSQQKKRLFIEIPANTQNVLTDGSSYVKVAGEDQRGCIFAEGQICLSGQGQLYINANKKCGIASDDYVHQLGGFVHVNAAAPKGKAVYGKDHVIVGGGVLRTYSTGAAGKGITSDSLLTVSGGLIKAITTGNAVWDEAEQDYSSCCCIKSNWAMSLSGGTICCLSTGTGGKGISAGHKTTTVTGTKTKTDYHGTLTVTDADIFVRTTGTRIPEVKQEDGHGNIAEAASSPKGIKSADKITVNSGQIYVRCSGGAAAEGIESKKAIVINGGTIRTYCVDDGMNASGCTMNGGDVLICSSENDGFDTGYLYMNGGRLYTIGADIAQMGLDTDGKTFKVTGGEIISLGARNCQPGTSSTQAGVLCYVHKHISGLALADAAGNIIRAIPTPNTYNTVCVLFSNDNIHIGDSYTILSYENSFSDPPATEYSFTAEGIRTTLGHY